MTEQKPQHTIYIDLDGVVFPYWHKSDGGYINTEEDGSPRLRSELQAGLDAKWIDRDEFYYPAITKRLGELAARGVNILPSSSRSVDLFLFYDSIAEDLGGVDRYLSIDRFVPASISRKAEAVLNNWQGVIDLSSEQRGWERLRSTVATHPLAKPLGSRAVWIDDQATNERIEKYGSERVREIFNDPSLKIVSPLGTVGLTMTQLDDIEMFLLREE